MVFTLFVNIFLYIAGYFFSLMNKYLLLLFSYLIVAGIQKHSCSLYNYLVSSIIVELSDNFQSFISRVSLIFYTESHFVCKE